MKKNNVFGTVLVIVLLMLVFPGVIFSRGSGKTGFSIPQKGDTLIRPEFDVSLEISNFDRTSGHYWVAIASVKGHRNKDWKRVCDLYKKSRGKQNAARKEMNELISEWKLVEFWPKNYINKSPYESRVHDGGKAPLPGLEPQPMILLIIKVDDKLNNYIIQWLENGRVNRSWDGLVVKERLSESMILSRCEIFFDE